MATLMTRTKDMARPLPRTSADDARWRAVERRDPAADFVYSVRTTGVYCRPSCAARRPRRENVAFHATCAEAERAAFARREHRAGGGAAVGIEFPRDPLPVERRHARCDRRP